MNTYFTASEKEAMLFKSFGDASRYGDFNLGEGLYEITHKGGIRIVVKHPANKGLLYVKQFI